MPSSFTFSFVLPGLTNPFAQQAQPSNHPSDSASTSPTSDADLATSSSSRAKRTVDNNFRFERPRPSRSPSPLPLDISALQSPAKSKKRSRGWEPSTSGPSMAATSATSTAGYLDTPAKYRDIAFDELRERADAEDMGAELPAAKRRRTLTGSIVSTAVSAALIGSAVGLTVYRLWRDRGKEPEPQQISAPPPPYHEGDWAARAPQSHPLPLPEIIEPESEHERYPQSPHRHPRRATTARHSASSKRMPAATSSSRHRRTRSKPHTQSQTNSISASQAQSRNRTGEEEEPDQMDWIGDRLAKLIEEGKKALGREVVVATDADPEVDFDLEDDPEAWVEDRGPDMFFGSTWSTSRAGSSKRSRPQDLSLTPAHSTPAWSISTPGSGSGHTSPPGGLSVPHTPVMREDPSLWSSPQLKETMEAARARYYGGNGRA